MNQKKIGAFLKELRNEKNLTQEQLAEILGVTNRSVSRWETGATMPDFDLLIQLSEYFGVGVGELLDGERAPEKEGAGENDTLIKVADYSANENINFSKRLRVISLLGLAALSGYAVIGYMGLSGVYGYAADFLLGLVFGAFICSVLYTSKHMSKIRAFKMRLIGRLKRK